jgi:hypothetical protein
MISLQFSFRINGIREKIRPQNYDPIAPSHTGQIQTHKLRLLKVFDSKISLIPGMTLNKPNGIVQRFSPFQQSHSFALTDQ